MYFLYIFEFLVKSPKITAIKNAKMLICSKDTAIRSFIYFCTRSTCNPVEDICRKKADWTTLKPFSLACALNFNINLSNLSFFPSNVGIILYPLLLSLVILSSSSSLFSSSLSSSSSLFSSFVSSVLVTSILSSSASTISSSSTSILVQSLNLSLLLSFLLHCSFNSF